MYPKNGVNLYICYWIFLLGKGTDLTQGTVLLGDPCVGHGVEMRDTEGNITSPRYPNKYPKSLDCWWNITVAASHRIEITFVHLDLDGIRYMACHDMVRIFGVTGTRDTEYKRVCGKLERLESRTVYINSNKAAVHFRSHDETIPGTGFIISYRDIPCPGVRIASGASQHDVTYNTTKIHCTDARVEDLTCTAGQWYPSLSSISSACVEPIPVTLVEKADMNKTVFAPDGPSGQPADDKNPGLVIGIVVGCVVIACLAAVIIGFILFRRSKFRKRFRKSRGGDQNGDSGKPLPLSRPDIITIIPNYSEPNDGGYTEPVEENTPDTHRKVVAGMAYSPKKRSTTSPTKSLGGTSNASSKSSHAYDLPYHVKYVDRGDSNASSKSNPYDMPKNYNGDSVKSNGSNYYDMPESPKKPPGRGRKYIMEDDTTVHLPEPDYPAPPTPAPPPVPTSNRVPSMYEDDPKPYACVDIFTPGKPVIRSDSDVDMHPDHHPSVSSFKVAHKT